MKIIILITPEMKLTVEFPDSMLPHLMEKVQTLLSDSRKGAVAPNEPGLGIPRFVCSTWSGSISREISAADAFTATECFAGLIMPEMRLPWKHTDRDFEKLRRFGDGLRHRVRSADGFVLPVIVREIR